MRFLVLQAPNVKYYVLWSFWLTRASRSVLEQHYRMKRLINNGSFARVVEAVDIHTGRQVAIKLIEKSNAAPTARRYMEREVRIMKMLSHPNVVTCLDIFDTRLRTRIVMELCTGGTLSDVIARQKGPLPESHAAHILGGVLAALKYLHEEAFVTHRDLKPDNILMPSLEAPYGPAKLSDFGLSNFVSVGIPRDGLPFEEDAVLTSAVGSPGFVAPEIFESTYGTAVDMWAAGVILYMMLAGGDMPFAGSSTQQVMSKIRQGAVDFSRPALISASESARNLILGLLNVNSSKRLTASQALQHPWFALNRMGACETPTGMSSTQGVDAMSIVEDDEDEDEVTAIS